MTLESNYFSLGTTMKRCGMKFELSVNNKIWTTVCSQHLCEGFLFLNVFVFLLRNTEISSWQVWTERPEFMSGSKMFSLLNGCMPQGCVLTVLHILTSYVQKKKPAVILIPIFEALFLHLYLCKWVVWHCKKNFSVCHSTVPKSRMQSAAFCHLVVNLLYYFYIAASMF